MTRFCGHLNVWNGEVCNGERFVDKFDKLSPESQERVRRVAANLLTRRAIKTGMTREQALAKATARVVICCPA